MQILEIRFKEALYAYATDIIQDRHRLLYINIIGSDSIARGIAAGIVQEANTDLEYRLDESTYWRTARAKDRSAKYRMVTTKLADNAVSVQIYHEVFTAPELRDTRTTKDAGTLAPDPARAYLLNDSHDEHEAVFNHINKLSTPLIPEFKKPLVDQLRYHGLVSTRPYYISFSGLLKNSRILIIDVTDEQLDQLVSEMIADNKLEF
jgi:hypothetical protein